MLLSEWVWICKLVMTLKMKEAFCVSYQGHYLRGRYGFDSPLPFMLEIDTHINGRYVSLSFIYLLYGVFFGGGESLFLIGNLGSIDVM